MFYTDQSLDKGWRNKKEHKDNTVINDRYTNYVMNDHRNKGNKKTITIN